MARLVKPGWKVLSGTAAAMLLWLVLPALGRRLEFFRVRRLELVGVYHLPPHTVVDALRLRVHASIFDELAPLSRRVAALGGITAAEVERRMPGTLRVLVTEAAPVALTPRVNAMGLIDDRGRLLPFDPVRSAPDLPVAETADSAVAALLGRARELDPALFAEVTAAWRAGPDVVLEAGGRRLWFRPEASAEEMHAVMAVAQDLARQGRAYAELDGRFAGQVVVRWSRS